MEDFDDGWPGYEEPVFVTHRNSVAGGIPNRLYRGGLFSIRPRYRLSDTPGSIQSPRRPICSEFPFEATATVQRC